MKTIKYFASLCLLFTYCGCDFKDGNLNQLDAEETAKQFISQNTFKSDSRNWGEAGTFGNEGITNISPISQFSETEASLLISFDYKVSPEFEFLNLKFNYKKDVNDIWMLNSVEEVQGVYSETGLYSKRLQTILDNAKNLTIEVANSGTTNKKKRNEDNLDLREQELKIKKQELDKREQELNIKEKYGNDISSNTTDDESNTSDIPKIEVINKSYEGEWINEKGQKLNITKLNDKTYTVKGCPKAEQSVFDIKPEATYNAALGNDGTLYVGSFCHLTLNGNKLTLESQSYKNNTIVYSKNSNMANSKLDYLCGTYKYKETDSLGRAIVPAQITIQKKSETTYKLTYLNKVSNKTAEYELFEQNGWLLTTDKTLTIIPTTNKNIIRFNISNPGPQGLQLHAGHGYLCER